MEGYKINSQTEGSIMSMCNSFYSLEENKMNLNELKMKSADRIEIDKLKENAFHKFKELLQLIEQLGHKREVKSKKVVDAFIYDFEKFMKKNNFRINNYKDSISTNNNSIYITATYNKETISLIDTNNSEDTIQLMYNNNCFAKFKIDSSKRAADYGYLTNDITVGSKKLDDFGKYRNVSFSSFLDSLSTSDELHELIIVLKEKINLAQKEIDKIDQYKFYIYGLNPKGIYENPKDFIEKAFEDLTRSNPEESDC